MNINENNIETIITAITQSEDLREFLIELSQRDSFDHLISLGPIIIAVLGLFIGYKSFSRKVKELRNEQIILKDIDKLYEAANSFFTYVDSARLFFSLVDKRALRTINGKSHEGEFRSNFEHAENDFFPKISKIKESIFILKTLEEKELASMLENLNDIIIENRRKQKLVLDNKNNKDGLKDIHDNYEILRKEINTRVEECTLAFINAKKQIGNNSKI